MSKSAMVRNVVLLGHSKSGKTSLAEAMLYTAGRSKQLGRVDDNTSTMDFEPEEKERKLTLSLSFNNFPWNGHHVFLTDTPGDDNFVAESMYAARVSDGAVMVIGAVLGVKGSTARFANIIKDSRIPAIIHVNRMDKERANFDATVAAINSELGFKAIPVQLPIGAEENFKGYVDVISGKAFSFDGDSGKAKEIDVPEALKADLATARESLMENVAETDDELIEKFLEEGELAQDDLVAGLKNAVAAGLICPVTVGAATANLGTASLLDLACQLLPAPTERPAIIATPPDSSDPLEIAADESAPFAALVFKSITDPYAGKLSVFRVFSGSIKTASFLNASRNSQEKGGGLMTLAGKNQEPVDELVPGMIGAVAKLKDTTTGDTICDPSRPVIIDILPAPEPGLSFAVEAVNRKEEEKLFASLNKVVEEDPALKIERQSQTRQTLLSGMGQLHLEVCAERVKRKYGVEMKLSPPKIPYKETIRGKARAQGKHKKQTGGHGQYADSWIEIEPLPRGGGFEFEDRIVGGVIPKQFIPAVEKGVLEAMERGILAGYPVVDVKVALVDGSFHSVDSSEMAFKISGSLAFRKAAEQAGMILLEPVMNMTIRVPKECVGDIIGDLNSRRGRVMGMDSGERCEVITAQAPLAEIQTYANELTSITGGRGEFSTEFSHYEEVPANLAEKIVEQARQEAA